MGRKLAADMTPEELAARRLKSRDQMRRLRAAQTPEQKAKDLEKARERANARYRSLSKEERAAKKKKQYRRSREILASVSPEERERRLSVSRANTKKWFEANRKQAQEMMRRRYAALPEDEKERRREQGRVRAAAWRAARTEEQKREIVAYQSRYNTERKKVDPTFRVMTDIRGRLRHACERRNQTRTDASTMELLGCTWKEFAAFVESQFVDGMTWKNKGHHTWHIDHVVPLAAFNLSIDAEARVASHYLNHRPAWASENLAKSSRMPKPDTIPARLREMCLALDADFFKRPTYRRRASAASA